MRIIQYGLDDYLRGIHTRQAFQYFLVFIQDFP